MNKKFLAVSLVSFVALGSLPVFASQSVQTSEHSGYAIADNNSNGLEHEQVGGGDWWHGIDFGFLKSYYQHQSLEHHASVSADGGYTESNWEAPGTRAEAMRLPSPVAHTNHMFWATR